MLDTLKRTVEKMGLSHKDCHAVLPRDSEFKGLGLGGGAICLEEAFFLAGLIAVIKPDVVIELGTAYGASAVAIGSILKDFKKGVLKTVDIADTPPKTARDIILDHKLPVEFVTGTNSLDYIDSLVHEKDKIYLIFSDTEIDIRPTEVNKVIEKFGPNTFVVVHDTSPLHPRGPMNLEKGLNPQYKIMNFPTPRGISVVVYDK